MKKALIVILMLFTVVISGALVACGNDTDSASCQHNYSAWSEVRASTCEKEGVETRTCKKCKVVDKKMTDMHKYDYTQNKSPPCNEPTFSDGLSFDVSGEKAVVTVLDTSVDTIVIPKKYNGKDVTLPKGVFAECSNLVNLTLPFVGENAEAKEDDAYLGVLFASENKEAPNDGNPDIDKFYAVSLNSTVAKVDGCDVAGHKDPMHTGRCTACGIIVFVNHIDKIKDEDAEGNPIELCDICNQLIVESAICDVDNGIDHIDPKHTGTCTRCGEKDYEVAGQEERQPIGVIHSDPKHTGKCEVCEKSVKVYHVDEVTKIYHDEEGKKDEEGEIVSYEPDGKCDVCREPVKQVVAKSKYFAPKSLVNLKITGDVPSNAFMNFTKIKSAIFTNSVNSLGSNLFFNCGELEEIVLPFTGMSRDAIEQDALTGNLFMVDITATTEKPFLSITQRYIKKGEKTETPATYAIPAALAKMVVKGGRVSSNTLANFSMIKDIVFDEAVEYIAVGALNGFNTLEKITLPFIGTEAKQSESSIDGVFACIFGTTKYVDSYVVNLEHYVKNKTFYVPNKLTEVTIMNGTTVNKMGFYKVLNVTTLNLPDTITKFCEGAFYGASGLTELKLPASLASVHYNAFSANTSLGDITLDSSNTTFKVSGNCLIEIATKTLVFGTKDAVIPTDGSVEIIGKGAFDGMIKTVKKGEGSSATEEATVTIVIPASVKTISDYAFYNCSGLKVVEMGSGVTSIGVAAFRDCINLESIDLTGIAEENIAPDAFYNCPLLVDEE